MHLHLFPRLDMFQCCHGSAKAAGCAVWSPFWRNVTAENVKEAQALGLEKHEYWMQADLWLQVSQAVAHYLDCIITMGLMLEEPSILTRCLLRC